MIRQINRNELAKCTKLIRDSFLTVANEFGFTVENASDFTAFAITEEKLVKQLEEEQRLMYGYYDNDNIVGFYSLLAINDEVCELNNLCVSPSCRHKGIGEALLKDVFEVATNANYKKISIGIVEENKKLRAWYESFGFVHTGTEKFDFFPFTCGYLEKELN